MVRINFMRPFVLGLLVVAAGLALTACNSNEALAPAAADVNESSTESTDSRRAVVEPALDAIAKMEGATPHLEGAREEREVSIAAAVRRRRRVSSKAKPRSSGGAISSSTTGTPWKRTTERIRTERIRQEYWSRHRGCGSQDFADNRSVGIRWGLVLQVPAPPWGRFFG